MSELSQLKNIGKTIEKRLNAIGIKSKADLKKIGSIKAFQQIKKQNPEVTIPVCYYLYSLEGALRNVHWDDLSENVKTRLKNSVEVS